MGTKQASFLLGISRQRLLVLLAQGRVKGAEKKGRFWEIRTSSNGMPIIIPARRGPKGKWRKQKSTKPKMIHVQDLRSVTIYSVFLTRNSDIDTTCSVFT